MEKEKKRMLSATEVTPASHECMHCGASFPSRNKVFKHARTCDKNPAVREAEPETKSIVQTLLFSYENNVERAEALLLSTIANCLGSTPIDATTRASRPSDATAAPEVSMRASSDVLVIRYKRAEALKASEIEKCLKKALEKEKEEGRGDFNMSILGEVKPLSHLNGINEP